MQIIRLYRFSYCLSILLFVIIPWCKAQTPLEKWVQSVRNADSSWLLTKVYNFPGDHPMNENEVKEMLHHLDDNNPYIRAGIVIRLGELRFSPAIIVPRLIGLMKDKDKLVREHAVIALSKYDSFAVKELVKALKDNRIVDSNMRVGKDGQTMVLVSDLAMIGLINCKSIDVKHLFKAYRDPRISNMIKYISINNKYISASDILLYLKSGSTNEKFLALTIINESTIEADEALPLVFDLTTSSKRVVREKALQTLTSQGPKALPLISNILKKRKHNVEERELLVSGLDKNGVESLPLLINVIETDPNAMVRSQAVRTISDIGFFSAETGNALGKALFDSNKEVAEEASNVLTDLMEDSVGNGFGIVPLLIKALRSNSGIIQGDAAYLLGKMEDLGDFSNEAVNEMLSALRRPAAYKINHIASFSGSPEEKFITAIGAIKISNQQTVIDVFGDILQEDSLKRLHGAVVEALGKIGAISNQLVPLILKKSGTRNVFPSLSRIEPSGVDSLIAIVQNIQYTDSLRELALRALGDGSVSSSKLQLVLKNVLVDPQSSAKIRNASAQSLFFLGFCDSDVEQELQNSLLKDDEISYKDLDILKRSKKKNIPFIRVLFENEKLEQRESLLELLWQLGPDSLIDDILVSALNNKDEEIRERAGELLSESTTEYLLDLTRTQKLVENLGRLISFEISTKGYFDDWKRVQNGATRVTQPILPAFQILNRLGPDARQVLPTLLPLLNHADKRLRVETIHTIGRIGIDTLNASTEMQKFLWDKDRHIRVTATRSLSVLEPEIAFTNVTYFTVCADDYVSGEFSKNYDDIADRLRPSNLVSGRFPRGIPPFPWPPPKYSNIAKFGDDLPLQLIGSNTTTLSAIYNKLINALIKTDRNFEQGLFGVPGGFALLAKMERIQEDGTPLAGKYRWVQGKIPPQSLADYIGQLFFETRGYFRLIAFVFTEETNFIYSNKKLPEIQNGGHDFPPELVNKTFQDMHGYVLIYSFKRVNGGTLSDFNQLSALSHLQASGIYNNISR